jgi:hypothetical protein
MMAAFSRRSILVLFLFSAVSAGFVLTASAATVKQKGFASPEDAVQALVKAIKKNDKKEVSAIFGPEAKALMSSGDPVEDKEGGEQFAKAFEESYSIRLRSPEVAILHIGSQDFSFPIPLVKNGNTWVFDGKAGKEEVVNRRIGRNELNTMEVLRAYVNAQREYYDKKLGKDGSRAYSQKLFSTKGKKDGLYWPVKEGEEESPLGPLVASAAKEGYAGKGTKPIPYHGYFFRVLTGQGSHAAGGVKQYIVSGAMTEGFALVAHPAKYGSSGIMTFVVNRDGVIHEKNLGIHTDKVVKAMKLYDPDSTWKTVPESIAGGQAVK